jgi:hypothetical protein
VLTDTAPISFCCPIIHSFSPLIQVRWPIQPSFHFCKHSCTFVLYILLATYTPCELLVFLESGKYHVQINFALIDIGKWPQGNWCYQVYPLWKRKELGNSMRARITNAGWSRNLLYIVHGNLTFKEIRNKRRDLTQNCQKVFNCSFLGMSLGVICSVCSLLKLEPNYVYNVLLACLELYCIEICMIQFSHVHLE